MKSIIRWGTTLGIIGSTIVGSAIVGGMRVLALPQEQILQKLGPVPVFTITDQKGAPLVASQPNQKNKPGVAGVFINRQDAQAFVERLKKKDPSLAKSVRVVPVSLGEVYKLEQTNQKQPNSLDFAFVPSQQQVDAAMTLMRQNGQKIDKFNGTPLFAAVAGKEKGYITIQQNNKSVIPFFFNKEELQTAVVDRLKKEKPELASTVEIQVVNLEGIIKTLQSSDKQDLNQIELVPPRESVEFVRTQQQTAPGQSQPASNAPSKTPAAPKR